MDLLSHQQAFGGWDKTTDAMRQAQKTWFSLYYGDGGEGTDPCQRVAYTIVNKLTRSVFAEYSATSESPQIAMVLRALDRVAGEAVQQALVGGEAYLKPCVDGAGFTFVTIPRDKILIFARDIQGMPTDVGTAERSSNGRFYYTLLERRTVDEKGYLTMENKLYRSRNLQELGQEVSLKEHPLYAGLAKRYTYPEPVGSIGLVRLKTPMVNCVDGSADGVSVYAPAVGLIANIDRNEAQLCGEFNRGESRILVSSDLLENGALRDNVFVGLDQGPEELGLHIFSPQLREQSYLARKQEYMRNVESVIGLKRGLLSDANVEERTATEIAASQSEQNLAAMDFQQMWTKAVHSAVALCKTLYGLYRMGQWQDADLVIDWGNGVLFDEEKVWADYLEMVRLGLLAPEVALGWRFNLPCQTEEERAAIRKKFMPDTNGQWKIDN